MPGRAAFAASPLSEHLIRRSANTVIVTGSETDVCVLATVLAAVDRSPKGVRPYNLGSGAPVTLMIPEAAWIVRSIARLSRSGPLMPNPVPVA